MPPPDDIAVCQFGDGHDHPEGKASMQDATIIGIDLAKRSFQVHGATADGSVAFRKKLSRTQLLPFLAMQPGIVALVSAERDYDQDRSQMASGASAIMR